MCLANVFFIDLCFFVDILSYHPHHPHNARLDQVLMKALNCNAVFQGWIEFLQPESWSQKFSSAENRVLHLLLGPMDFLEFFFLDGGETENNRINKLHKIESPPFHVVGNDFWTLLRFSQYLYLLECPQCHPNWCANARQYFSWTDILSHWVLHVQILYFFNTHISLFLPRSSFSYIVLY